MTGARHATAAPLGAEPARELRPVVSELRAERDHHLELLRPAMVAVRS